MTDPTEPTIAVPVSLIERFVKHSTIPFDDEAALAALLPKPVPRIVPVNLDVLADIENRDDIAALVRLVGRLSNAPDLMATIEQVLNDVLLPKDAATAFARIRSAVEAATR